MKNLSSKKMSDLKFLKPNIFMRIFNTLRSFYNLSYNIYTLEDLINNIYHKNKYLMLNAH